jgi:hypothetical protein
MDICAKSCKSNIRPVFQFIKQNIMVYVKSAKAAITKHHRLIVF